MLPGLVMHTSPSSLAAQHAATSRVWTTWIVSVPLATGIEDCCGLVARWATGATTRSSRPVMPTMVPAGTSVTTAPGPARLPSAARGNASSVPDFSAT